MQKQLKELDNEMKTLRAYVEALVQPPIGSIIPWFGRNNSNTSLPNGWQLCDGSLITDEKSPMFDQKTPDLNGVGDDGLFIRGGSESEAGLIAEDSLKNHSHDALGHNHAQQEHHHHYRERNGVDMALVSAPDCDNYTYGVLIDGPDHNVTWIPGVTWPDNSRVCMDRVATTASATASITQEKEKIGGIRMENGTTEATETRPKNMKAVFI